MTKERLEELHKQGATIIRVTGQGLSKTISKFYLDPSREYYFDDYDLSIVYETEEHYKWQRKTHAERTERFEPPMWDDIKNTYGFRFIYYDDIIEFTVNYSTMLDGVEFNTQKIVIRNLDERELLFVEKATKKNYEKACEIVRDLFGGTK